MPVTTVLAVGLIPTISISSLILIVPRSIRPVTTVPRPSIEKISSIGNRNGFSVSRTGSGIFSSTAAIKSQIGLAASSSADFDSNAFKAEPRIILALSPSNSYFVNSSRTSASTNSTNSSSSTISTLFKKTTISGTPTCFAKRMCSLVCGIGPSVAATTKIAPSIWAAPVIMFLI